MIRAIAKTSFLEAVEGRILFFQFPSQLEKDNFERKVIESLGKRQNITVEVVPAK
jgi:hypothetical protein